MRMLELPMKRIPPFFGGFSRSAASYAAMSFSQRFGPVGVAFAEAGGATVGGGGASTAQSEIGSSSEKTRRRSIGEGHRSGDSADWKLARSPRHVTIEP